MTEGTDGGEVSVPQHTGDEPRRLALLTQATPFRPSSAADRIIDFGPG